MEISILLSKHIRYSIKNVSHNRRRTKPWVVIQTKHLVVMDTLFDFASTDSPHSIIESNHIDHYTRHHTR